MKFPKAGCTTMTLGITTLDTLMAASGKRLLGSATLTAGRTFWLRQFGLFALDNTTGAGVCISDATEGATGTSATLGQRRFVCWGPTIGATGCNLNVTFNHPGLKFTTDCVIALFGASTATGMFKAWGIGYEA